MKTEEVYELTTRGGASDFARVVEICRRLGPYCLVGGLAVNCYVEPVYTLDADFVMIASNMAELKRELVQSQFRVEEFAHDIAYDFLWTYHDELCRKILDLSPKEYDAVLVETELMVG